MQLKGKVFYLIPTLRETLFKNRERKGSLSKNNPGMIELTDFGRGKRLRKRIRTTGFKGYERTVGIISLVRSLEKSC